MRIRLLSFTVFIFTLNTYSQVQFQDHLIINSQKATLGASSVYAADLDGDGDMDMLSASLADDKIAWYENTNGQGDFGDQQIITTNTDWANSVKASDLDGDGDLDVLSASLYDDKIAWYENTDGSGNFGPQQIISLDADFPNSIHAADMDGDGDADVLSASSFDNKIAWYENMDGQGTFGSQQTITVDAMDARSVYAGDLDGDGDLDVLSASNADDKIAWYENTNGQGDFGEQQVITTETDRANSVYAIDIDGDGDEDVLSASYQDGKIAWYENTDGEANFSPQKIITDSFVMATVVFAADIDGDNDVDVFGASAYDEGKITWYENMDAQGTFGEEQIITTNVSFTKTIFAADLNSDGNIDILSASETDDKIAWYENTDGQGNFGAQQIISSSVYDAHSVYAADLDGDGDDDVISAARGDGKITWYENDGQGNFGLQKIINSHVSGAMSIYAIDLDGDNDIDVLSASWNNDRIEWYENLDGTGTIWDAQEITIYPGMTADAAMWVTAADMDGDNDMDVLSASAGDNKMAWYENLDGQGDFGNQQIITNNGGYGLQEIHACDLDGDGDMDVVSVWSSDEVIAWFENTDGSGNFGPQQNIVTNIQGTYAIYPSDLDNDGDKDVLASFIGDLAWFENEGAGNFGSLQLIGDDGNSSSMVHATDIDGDGDQDVLYGGLYEDTIRWYKNDGTGNFGEPQILTTNAGGTRSLFSADLNSDGYPDILSAAWKGNPTIFEGGNKIMWYENLDNFSINESILDNFSIYPNPTSDILKINSKISVKKIKVHNSLGQLVLTNSDQNQIDLSKLNAGIYFVKIKGENGETGETGVWKVVKK